MDTHDSTSGAKQSDVPDLLASLIEDSPPGRRAAARALARRKDRQAETAIMLALDHENGDVRRAALDGLLRRIGGGPLGELPHSDEEFGMGSILSLFESQYLRELNAAKHVCFQLTLRLMNQYGYPAASERLRRLFGEQELAGLLSLLSNETARATAARLLGWLKEGQATEPLIAALADPRDEVRAAAAEALGRIGDTRAIGSLLDALADEWWTYAGDDRVYPVREAAGRALQGIGAPAVEVLIDALQSADVTRRRHAARILGKMADHRAVEPLLAATGDSDERVRRGAEISLRELRRPR